MKSQSIRMIVTVSLVAAAVTIGHLLPGLNGNQIDSEIRNALHIVGFATVAAFLFETLPIRNRKSALITLSLVIAIGALAEFAQKVGGKEIDLSDLCRDIAGATIYLCARLAWSWSNATLRSSATRYAGRLVSIGLLVALFVPLSYWVAVNYSIAARFPVILDFNGRWDTRVFVPIDSEFTLLKSGSNDETENGYYAEFQLLRRSWSGLRIEPVVSDWSDYEYLAMEAAIIGGYESSIVIHFSDGDHPGYRLQHLAGSRRVDPEMKTIRFPLRGVVDIPGRPSLDPSRIDDVYIIGKTKRKGKDKSGETRMYLNDIRLE